MRTIQLNDGSVLECDLCSASEGVLCMNLPGITITEAALTFSDTAKTSFIIFRYGEMIDEFEGYTSLINLLTQDGYIIVMLRREN